MPYLLSSLFCSAQRRPRSGVLAILLALPLAALAATAAGTEADPSMGADPFDTLTAPATATTPSPDAAQDPLRNEADLSAAAGMAALKDATTDQQQAVSAALSFSHALKLYQRLGDGGRVTEMQAQLFWCKKNMGVDALAALAEKGGAGPNSTDNVSDSHRNDARTAAAVMNETVPENQAQGYFDSAADFRKHHPDEHYLNAMRFSAVVACFSEARTSSAKAVVAKAQAIATTERDLYEKSGQQDPTPAAVAANTQAAPAEKPAPPVNAAPVKPAAPVASGGPTPEIKAQWGDKLYARVREEIARKRPPRFTSSLIKDTVEITAADSDGNMKLRFGDSTMDWAWKRVPDGDRVSLSVGMVRDAEMGDHCIAAFYLFLAGKTQEANKQLLKVGAPADELRALFGVTTR